MISRIHSKLGTAGFIISIVALVAALGGGAYAASAKLNSTQKKEVTKIAQTEAKKFAGKQGAPGAAGPAGAKGDAGSPGARGTDGANGTSGSNGKSVLTSSASGTECKAGGTKFEVEGSGKSSKVCNGNPAEYPEVLPPGRSEIGVWSVGLTPPAPPETTRSSISFPIPLLEPIASAQVHYVKPGDPVPTGCTGGTLAEPTAEPGNFCVYASQGGIPFSVFLDPATGGGGAGTAGTTLIFFTEASPEAGDFGTWAVTAKEG